MRKTLLILLGVLMAFPVLARDFEYPYEGQTLTYEVIDEDAKTCKTKSCKGNLSGELIIPEIAKDGDVEYTVTEIGMSAFNWCIRLTSVTIPNSVTSIGDYSFCDCSSLTSVTIPNSVTEIGWKAFEGCSGLTSVTIPNSVTIIGPEAFRGCSGLTSVTIPNSVTDLGSYAFSKCSGLAVVLIGKNISFIGNVVFDGCSGIKKIAYPNTLKNDPSNKLPDADGIAVAYDPNEVIVENGLVFDPNKKEVLFASYAADGKYFVPETCTAIGDNAYSYSSNMTSIEINDNVTSIGNRSFSNCEMLEDVILPLRLESIGSAVFENSGAIKNVVFRGPTPVEGSADVFESSVYEYATLYVRSGRVTLFQIASPWKFFFNITDKSYEKTQVSSLSFKQSSYTAEVGETIDLNDEVVILPADATDKTLVWKSSDESVATVSEGIVTVLAEGTCEITATTTDGSNLSAVCAINASSGIESVMAADGLCDVYSMSGIIIMRNVALSEVDSLAPGIYIIRQGVVVKKVVVK